jgi:glutathione S-transferase
MRLYHFPPTRALRVRWVLQELEAPCELVTVDMGAGEHKRPAFLALNPAGKLPVLVDGDLVLTESMAIVLYLADKYPEKGLMPADPKLRAEVNQWLFFVATELEQPLWRIRRQTAFYAPDKRSDADVEMARAEFAAMAAVAEAHMEGREFVVGDVVTVADFMLAHVLDWAKITGLLTGLPVLGAYTERMYARPKASMRLMEALTSTGFGMAPASVAAE